MDSLPNPTNSETRTLLVVDDHSVVRASLRDWLMIHFPEYIVLEAANGEEAVTLASKQSLTLTLMDVSLPGMTGIEATRRIKQIQPQTLIVIISIHEATVYQTDALAAGANAFIPKLTMHTGLSRVLPNLLAQPVQPVDD